MRTIEHMKENNILFSGNESLSDEEEKLLAEACRIFREEVSVLCTSCNYCLNDCPADINIPKVIELYNYLKTDKPWNRKEKIESVDSNGKPSDCTSCGVCVSRCPQKIDVAGIMEELKK
jgi:predicted aldo/keto reductase-like oxidoreductase